MIATWLRAELVASERFSSHISAIIERMAVDAKIVSDPDVSDAAGNAVRKQVFREYRGYGTDEGHFLSGFPEETIWERVALTPEEILSVLYIDWDYWIELSGGSRRPQDAVKAILAGRKVYDVPNEGFLEIAAAVRSGRRFPPIISVTSGEEGSQLVVIEGHARLTGYVLAAEALPPETEALVGTASAFERWWAY